MRTRRAWTTITTARHSATRKSGWWTTAIPTARWSRSLHHTRPWPVTAMRTPIDLLGAHAMNATAISFTLALALAVVSPAMAQATQPHAHHPAAAASADVDVPVTAEAARSEEHTSELQSLMRISYAVFCLKKKNLKN